MHTFPSATDVSQFPEAPLVRRRSLNLISRAKKEGGRWIPTWTVFDVRISQDAGRGAAGSKRRWTSRRWRGKSEGGVFFFFYIIYSLLRYKKSHGALAMAKTKPKIQNELTKEKSGTNLLQLGSVPVPGPHTGTTLKQV